jgi:hypothetical protein
MPSINIRRHLASCLALAIFCATGWPQSPAPTPPSLTPDQLMHQASDALSLTAPDMKPWHLRASIKEYLPGGSVLPATIDEWWAGPDHYKLTYTLAGLSRTLYRSGNNNFIIGGKVMGAIGLSLLLHPLPPIAHLDTMSFTSKDASVGANKLRCLTEAPEQNGPPKNLVSTYCFDNALPVLRFSVDSFGERTIWDGIIRLQGHFLARKIRVSNAKQDPWITVDVDQAEPQLGIEESALVPPADARLLEGNAPLDPGSLPGYLISGENPSYPATAQSVRALGTVVLHAKISKEGAVDTLGVVNGPLALQLPAENAVKSWRFHPYMLSGEPVEAETNMEVNFQAGMVNTYAR